MKKFVMAMFFSMAFASALFAQGSGGENKKSAANLSGSDLVFYIEDLAYKNGVFESKDEITGFSKNLSFDEKKQIYTKCETTIGDSVEAFLINGVIGFGFGSLIMGDYEGFKIQVLSDIGGIGLLVSGFIVYAQGLDGKAFSSIKMSGGRILLLAGSALLSFSRCFGVARPWYYRDSRNNLLRAELGLSKTRFEALPYVDVENNSFGLVASISF